MDFTVCTTRTAYERLPTFIDEALQSFRYVAENLDLPVRYRVQVEVLRPIPGPKKGRQLDLQHGCSAHVQLHAETVSNTRPRKGRTS